MINLSEAQKWLGVATIDELEEGLMFDANLYVYFQSSTMGSIFSYVVKKIVKTKKYNGDDVYSIVYEFDDEDLLLEVGKYDLVFVFKRISKDVQ